MTTAILGMSLYLFGISFAPIITPHLSEAFGRSPVYFTSIPIFSLFILGAGLSDTFAGVAICRFLAGFSGGPCLVLIEGTFADVWGAEVTGTYYSVLGLSSYLGAAFGMVSFQYEFHTNHLTTQQDLLSVASFSLLEAIAGLNGSRSCSHSPPTFSASACQRLITAQSSGSAPSELASLQESFPPRVERPLAKCSKSPS